MVIEQIYTQCLSEAAYYVSSKGEAVIIDPLRDVDIYIQRAGRDKAVIKYVLLTHFHADFVSGHLELARKTGATIVFGPTAQTPYACKVVEDGELLRVGVINLKCLHTPGHTMESTCYLLQDEEGIDVALFSGDTLFLGDVGRPDLAVKTGEVTKEDLAGMLYDSLREKIMPLADNVVVYPNHGAGSACGKKMRKETSGILGDEKKGNYALRPDMTKEEFIKEVTNGLVSPPQYFPKNAILNKQGYEPLMDVRRRGLKALSLVDFKALQAQPEVLVLDARDVDEFAKAFIPGSIYVGLQGTFATWVGTLIENLQQAILFIAPEGREQEVVDRLARIGYDNAVGYLKGGFATWIDAGEKVDRLEELSANDFADFYHKNQHVALVDTRKESEYNTLHLTGAMNKPLDFIYREMKGLDKNEAYYLHCKSGYRSVIAASIMARNGFEKIINIKGGFTALASTNLPQSIYQQQNTAL